MVLQHINHKMPIYKDCTLGEVLLVSCATLMILGVMLSFLTWALFGFASIGCALSLLTLVHLSRFLLSRLQRLKYGKPYGYYQHLFLKKLAEISNVKLLWESPFVMRQGHWSVRRVL